MLRERLIDTAIRLSIDNQLRGFRAAIHPVYRRQRAEDQRLRLLLKSALTAHSNCIDIGAHRGRVLEEILRAAPLGKHIAYEPLPHLHHWLANHFPAVDVRLAAVSNQIGEMSFTYVKGEPALSGFQQRSVLDGKRVVQLTVRTEMLDRCLPDGYVPHLIKVDVEGAERQVFEGAIATITRHKPVVIFEHGKGGAPHYGTQPHHIYELLHVEAALNIFDLDGNGPYTLAQFEDEFERDERWNYVAYP